MSDRRSDSDEEEDELDAFMKSIDAQAKQEVDESKRKEASDEKEATASTSKGVREDLEEEDEKDDIDNYLSILNSYNERQQKLGNNETEHEYDDDGNIVWTWKREIDPLPSISHADINYDEFIRSTYAEHEDIEKLSPEEVFELRNNLGIKVFGADPPKPCISFAHFGFDETTLNQVSRLGYEKPTSIQAQGIPAALSGRDILGISATGSGKTFAYALPAILHVRAQARRPPSSTSPVALIVAPTRELAMQIYENLREFSGKLKIVCAHGGGSKYEQKTAIDKGVDICVGTPGRIIDLIKMKAMSFQRTSFLVFDEADRMFDMGFELQVKSISDHVRPDRQCLMFSATFPPKIEEMATNALSNPVKVLCGDIGDANADVEQHVFIFHTPEAKYDWLHEKIIEFMSGGKVIVFVSKKLDAETVAQRLQSRAVPIVLIHGDMHQLTRTEKLEQFRNQTDVLVCTDVAARGLDIQNVNTVVNFDVRHDIDSYIHRIGRTGRAGAHGRAYTLLTDKDREFAGPLIKVLTNADQAVPTALVDLAKTSKWAATNNLPTAAGRVRAGLGFGDADKGRPDVARIAAADSSKSITKEIQKAKSVAESSTGVKMSRYNTMRQYMKASYRGTFTKATDEGPPIIQPTAPEPLKKKSRWDSLQ